MLAVKLHMWYEKKLATFWYQKLNNFEKSQGNQTEHL